MIVSSFFRGLSSPSLSIFHPGKIPRVLAFRSISWTASEFNISWGSKSSIQSLETSHTWQFPCRNDHNASETYSAQKWSDNIRYYPNHATDPLMLLSIAQPSCQDQFDIANLAITAFYLSWIEKGLLYWFDDNLTRKVEEVHLSFLEFDTMFLVRTWIFTNDWKYCYQFPSTVRMTTRILQIANWCCEMIRNDQ